MIGRFGCGAPTRSAASRRAACCSSGSGPAKIELCKNLVLAGFSATICDHRKVDAASLGYNFFADAESIGKSAAEASIENIAELNPFADVKIGSTSSCTDAKTADALVAGHGVVIIDVPCASKRREEVNRRGTPQEWERSSWPCAVPGTARRRSWIWERSTRMWSRRRRAKKWTSAPQKASYCSYADAVGVAWNDVKNKKMAQATNTVSVGPP